MHFAQPLVLVAGLVLAGSAWAGEISLTTADGLTLKAEESGSGDYGVVLVHGFGRSRADWEAFGTKLAGSGYHVVAVDLRGHGATGGEVANPEDMNPAVADVDAAIAWLSGNGAKKVAVIGAEGGANLAINAASHSPAVTSLVVLSAGMNVKGVKSGTPLEAYGNRPVLIVASDDSAYEVKSASYLEGKALGLKHYELLPAAGSGTKMLTRNADLEPLLLSWLNGTWAISQGGNVAGAQKEVSGPSTEKVETTGTKFGDKKPGTPAPATPAPQ